MNIINMRNSGLILFVCAGLLLSGGAILGGSAAWTLMRISYYFWTTDLGVELGSSILFITGALLCLPACWLSTLVPYHPRSLPLLASLMLLVTATLVLLSTGMSSIIGLSRAVREPANLNSSMLRAMSLDAFDPSIKSAMAAMQLELKCCGVHSYADWYQHRRNLPPSCCGRLLNGKNGDQCDSPLFTIGCLRPALSELRMYINSLAALGCAIIIVMAVTLFATAYTLVTSIVERAAVPKYTQPLRIACVAPPTMMSVPSPVYANAPQAPI